MASSETPAGIPVVAANPAKIRKEITQKATTPAPTMSERWNKDFAPKLLGSALCPSSPVSLTKAPRGRRFKEYRVSPILFPKSLGGKPMPNSSTFTPNFFAARKCPSSWSTTNPIKLKNAIRNSILVKLYLFLFSRLQRIKFRIILVYKLLKLIFATELLVFPHRPFFCLALNARPRFFSPLAHDLLCLLYFLAQHLGKILPVFLRQGRKGNSHRIFIHYGRYGQLGLE